jgi:hypothetical protein
VEGGCYGTSDGIIPAFYRKTGQNYDKFSSVDVDFWAEIRKQDIVIMTIFSFRLVSWSVFGTDTFTSTSRLCGHQ